MADEGKRRNPPQVARLGGVNAREKIAEKMGFIRRADAGIFNSVDVNDKNGRSRKVSPQIRKTTRHRSSN